MRSLDGREELCQNGHGFGSSKESPMVQALHRALPERGIGVWSFDFPAHGDSPMGQEGLRVPFCMDDLETVEAWIRAKSPQVEVCYLPLVTGPGPSCVRRR